MYFYVICRFEIVSFGVQELRFLEMWVIFSFNVVLLNNLNNSINCNFYYKMKVCNCNTFSINCKKIIIIICYKF